MKLRSAGILLFRYVEGALEVLLVHPGGPFWVRCDAGAWSIPKGLVGENESLLEAAHREFREETGFDADGELIALGSLRQPSGKIVHAWALQKDIDAAKVLSNTFTLEWPRHSGVQQTFPEVDKAAWFALPQARRKIIKGQAAFLDRLLESTGAAER
jgi:predicted NUDIX family NTP pyrophosphohydrolase